VHIDRFAAGRTKKKDVLEIIFTHKKITRAELVSITGLSMTSVTKFVKNLMNDGIVTECGTLESTGGRKTTLLGINPDYAYVIGVDIGGYADKLGVVRMDGSLVKEWYIPASEKQSSTIGIAFDELCARIDQIIIQFGRAKVLAICIGISGMVDHQSGRIVFCPNLVGWNNLNLADELQKQMQIPVFVDTSTRCMALAEYTFGTGSGIANQVFISLGYSSIAAALIIDHKIYRGNQSFAGEIGHVMSSDEGQRCTCGNIDCLELSATLKMIIERVYENVRTFNGMSPLRQLLPVGFTKADITPAIIEQAIEAGDKQCYEVVHDAGIKVGTVLANMLNMIDIGTVIIGGGVIFHFPGMLETIKDTVRKRALITVQQNLEIKIASLDWHGSIIGSAILAQQAFFSKTNLTYLKRGFT